MCKSFLGSIVLLLGMGGFFLPNPAVSKASAEHRVPLKRACVVEAAEAFGLPESALWVILGVERGQVGERTPNPNDTYDYGPFQINTIWLEELSDYNISQKELLYNGCVNAMVAAWILHHHWDSERPFRSIGNYHSQTPEVHWRYRLHIMDLLTGNRDTTIEELIEQANREIEHHVR